MIPESYLLRFVLLHAGTVLFLRMIGAGIRVVLCAVHAVFKTFHAFAQSFHPPKSSRTIRAINRISCPPNPNINGYII